MYLNGLAWTEAETSFATATWDAAGCRIWVIRVVPTGSKASPNVCYAFNSDRICASQRTDAMCQQRKSKCRYRVQCLCNLSHQFAFGIGLLKYSRFAEIL